MQNRFYQLCVCQITRHERKSSTQMSADCVMAGSHNKRWAKNNVTP